MDSISEILHFQNPSFKKDFAFIKQLETENKEYQDRIWKKFALMQVSSEGTRRIPKTKFDSHPSGFTSDSGNSRNSNNTDEVAEFLREQPGFHDPSRYFSIRNSRKKHRSVSAGKMLSSELSRKKLRKKITQHLKNGTIDKFDIKAIGDQLAADRKEKADKKKMTKGNSYEEDDEEIEEVYVDCSKKFMGSTPSSGSKCSTYSSLNDTKAEMIELPSTPKMRSRMIKQLQKPIVKQKIGSTVKIDENERMSKSAKARELKKSQMVATLAELKKSRYYIEKCLSITNDIGMILNQEIIPPDGKEDFSRRKVRTNEFNSRFSRTYMYPLVRQISSINVPGTGEKAPIHFPRLGTAFQLVFQALQAYHSHLPNTVGTNSYHKLKQYLVYVTEVCDKSNKFFEKQPNCNNQEFTNMLKSQCTCLMSRIDDNFLCASVDSLLKAKSTKAVPPTSQSNKNLTVKSGIKDNQRSRRFAMYNDTMASKRDRQWRRMLEAVEKRKPKVKSRYRTATFKHRPPVEKQNNQMMIHLGKHRLDVRKSMTSWKNTPVATPMNEDNIQTMIQYEKECHDRKDDSGNDELEEECEDEEQREEETRGKTIIQEPKDQTADDDKHQQEDILVKLLRLVQDNHQQAGTEPDLSLTNTIKVLQQCLDFKNQNSELFRKIANDTKKKQLTVEKSCLITNCSNVKKRRKDPLITVSGTKNAQLICIKDDNSIVSEVEESSKQFVPQNSPRKTQIHAEVQSSKSDLMIEDGVTSFPSKMSIKISRINRSKRMLQHLPRDYVINVIQHKLLFHKQCKTNFMYKQTPNGKPWELMDKISEEVLDYALLGIAKEIEVNELLENIYNAEFQY